MDKQRQGQVHRVVVVPLPFQGHINPMIHLSSVLQANGFSILIAHPRFNHPNSSKHPEFTFLPLEDGLTCAAGLSNFSAAALISQLNDNCRDPLREILIKLMEEGSDDIVVIYDRLMYFAETVASQLNLLSLLLQSSSAINMVCYLRVPQLLKDGLIPPPDSAVMDLVPELHPLRFKDLPVSNLISIEALLQIVLRAKIIGSSSGIIWNTTEFLEQESLSKLRRQFQVPLFPIGPLHKLSTSSPASLLSEDAECITWLNKQVNNSVIYVSFGSLAPLTEEEFAEMAWGLADSKQPFLWVVRPGSVQDSEWIEQLPVGYLEQVGQRGCIVKWAPQKDVLAHKAVGGFWSHGGWNSTVESLTEGIPIICRPYATDQMIHGRYIDKVWRAGILYESELTREEIARHVRTLMVDEEGEELRKRAIELKRELERCTAEGGSTSKSLNELCNFISLLS